MRKGIKVMGGMGAWLDGTLQNKSIVRIEPSSSTNCDAPSPNRVSLTEKYDVYLNPHSPCTIELVPCLRRAPH